MEMDTIPESIITTTGSSSLLISSPLTGSNKTLIEREAINITRVHSTAIFHSGAFGCLKRISNSGNASKRKIVTMSAMGYSKNHPESPIA